jgi:hypothetical protein
MLLLALVSWLSGCAVLKKKSPEEQGLAMPVPVRTQPLSPEETEALMGEVGTNFIYGNGVGEAALNVGTVAVFPPYLAVVIGNAALSLSGYETVGVSTALPEDKRDWWEDFYDGLVSGPGRLAAAIAGEEYRTKEVARQRLEPFLTPTTPPAPAPSETRNENELEQSVE